MNHSPAVLSYTHFDLMNDELFNYDATPPSQIPPPEPELDPFDYSHSHAVFDHTDLTYEQVDVPSQHNYQLDQDTQIQTSHQQQHYNSIYQDHRDVIYLKSSKILKRRAKSAPNLRLMRERPARPPQQIPFEDLPPHDWIVIGSYPEAIANSVRKTLAAEFRLLGRYKQLYYNSKSVPPNPRKRRESVDLIWKPLSVFKVYTNIAPKEIEDTNYHDNIPESSCFGQINMRMKGAWKRSK